jgi:ribonuclease P protein component
LTDCATYKRQTQRFIGDFPRETDLSTIAARPQAAPRLSRPHGDHGRPQGAGTAQSQGAQASVGLIGRESACPASPVTAIERLKSRPEFLHVREGARFAAPTLVLQARTRVESVEFGRGVARFGFTATKSLGGAVLRNRARRRLKEAVRLLDPARTVDGYDYVLIARAGTLQRPFAEITKDLERALTKVHQAPKHQKAPNALGRDSQPPLPRDRVKPGQ